MMNNDRVANPPLERPETAREFRKNTVQHPDEKSASSGNKPKRPFFGLVVRKERWGLSWRGRLVLLLSLLLVACAFIAWILPFLAVTQPVESQYLVVEGWVPNYALEEAIAEFKSKPYKMIFTVGADPLTGVNVEAGDSVALEAYKRLEWMGVDPSALQAVPAHIKYRNRTYHSALALKKWFADNHVPVASFNLVTLGPHARRSRLLFQEAFGDQVKVGIIAIQNREYDSKRWWKYSEGVREVIGEVIGYIYARVVFHPSESSNL